MNEMECGMQSHSWGLLSSQPCKKIIPQLLLYISIFSFMYSYSFIYTPSLAHPPRLHQLPISSYSRILTHSLNKNYMFLICNGLLVFLAKTSGLMVPPDGLDADDMFRMRMDCSSKTGLEAKLEPLLDKFLSGDIHAKNRSKEEEEEKANEEVSIYIHESEDMEDVWSTDDDDDDPSEHQAGSRSIWLFNEEEFEEEDQKVVDINADELNQKFEDFIRRMKKGG